METIYPRRFGVFYDFRNPAAWRQPWAERYLQLIDQIAWVDAELAFDEVSISEHHFLDDGWTPSPLVLAAAVASRTSRVGIATNIIQLPLHHPLRIAEDALTVDILSQGRFRLGVAAGYREEEFAGLGVSTGDRASLMDEGIAIIRQAFTGQPFAFSGRHWTFPELAVAPGPMRPGGPEIWLGGRARPALERAAARGDGFMASSNEDVAGYMEARRSLGFEDAPAKTMRTARLIIDEDPERALRELSDHMLFHVNEYIEYGFVKRPPYTDARDLIRDGQFDIVDADGALDRLRTAGAAGVHEFHVYGVLPGEPVDSGSRRLDYISNNVLPSLRLGGSAPVAGHEEEGMNVE
jgi:alkanesulfonate monooxygenase SsuD/methylene tetrahydromethanopterin reductase-like flavin-dependent oxidoreductase (luciferase family)